MIAAIRNRLSSSEL